MKKASICLVFSIMLLVIPAGCDVNQTIETLSPDQVQALNEEETYSEIMGELFITYTEREDIVNDATDIVRVHLQSSEVKSLGGYPQTHSFLKVEETLKGNLQAGETIEVIEEGGIGDYLLGDLPPIRADNDYLLHLKESDGVYYVVGAYQGRFIIRNGYVFQQGTVDAKLQTYTPQPVELFTDEVEEIVRSVD